MMEDVNKIKVQLDIEGESIAIGELLLENKKIYFKFYESFLDRGLEISPIKLPLAEGIFSEPSQIFEGLFGVFDDSISDGWGRLLIDKKLSELGFLEARKNPLLRLQLIGSNGPGALTYHPIIERSTFLPSVDLDTIYQQQLKIEHSNYLDIDNLFTLNGSSGGARPKAKLWFDDVVGFSHYGIYSESCKPYLIKFPSTFDRKDIANIEYAYYLMACDCGIEISPSYLFESGKGRLFFGTQRFDITTNGRLHMHSMAAMVHDNFRASRIDYGHIMKLAFDLEKDYNAIEKVFRLAVFNVLSHNLDDHSKNFSFLMNKKGQWKFAPAYDLTFSTTSHGYRSTSCAGESKNPGKNQLLKLGSTFDLNNAKEIYDEIEIVIRNWSHYASEAMVSKGSSSEIEKEILR